LRTFVSGRTVPLDTFIFNPPEDTMETKEHLLNVEAIAPPGLRAEILELHGRVVAIIAEVDRISDAYLSISQQVDERLEALNADTRSAVVEMGNDPDECNLDDFTDGSLWFVYALTGMTELDQSLRYVADHTHPEELGRRSMQQRQANGERAETAQAHGTRPGGEFIGPR
jgi:hypothetical protein